MSLDMKAGSFVPHAADTDTDTDGNTIHAIVKQLPFIADADVDENSNEFVALLEAEFLKIHAFQRELPLCTQLLKHAILVLKQEASQYTTRGTSRNAHQPMLEEFIPLEKESNTQNSEIHKADYDEREKEEGWSDKKNWMSSVQLWNTYDSTTPSTITGDAKASDYMSVSNHHHTYPTSTESGKVEKEDGHVPELSLVAPRMLNHLKEQQDSKLRGTTALFHSPPPSTGRKQRRCWSAELHRKFVDALTNLGGAQVATPKQIREVMGVDGLTNDEVKSHLQKYRLHTRRVVNKSETDEYSESSKPSSSQSGSPDSPLQIPGRTAGDSMDAEDDEKSAGYCC